MDVLEQYATNNNGEPDTTKIMYEATGIKNIYGNKAIPLHSFWFVISDNGLYKPWAVVQAGTTKMPQAGNLNRGLFIRNEEIARNKSLVLNYFDEASFYYKNLFVKNNAGTKGGLNADPKTTRMFLLIVASTKDETLMPNCLTDARKVVEAFTDIAENGLGISIFVDSVYGNRYNRAEVEMALTKLKPGKNDIVVFYYSGHGFADQKQPKKQFPFIDLRDPNLRPRPAPIKMAMNIQDIYSIIIKKGARMNLVLSDCCNDTVEAKKPISTVMPPGTKGPVKFNTNNLTSLFMSLKPTNLLMTAATRDERAIITPRYSSYFTHFFIESLRTYLSPAKGNSNWLQVMDDTKKLTSMFAGKVPCPNGKNCIQTPKLLLPTTTMQ
jgi:Caspase domain